MSTTAIGEPRRHRARARQNAAAMPSPTSSRAATPAFAEFDVKTNRVANALIAMGLKKGDRIAYLGKNSDIYFELLMGAMKAGVVMAPVNWRLAGPEVAFIVADCKAPVLFVGPEFITQVRNIKDQLPSVRTSSPPKAARRNGRILRPGAMRRAATTRRCRSARRTSRSSSIRRAPPASRRARCCRMPTCSTWCRPARCREAGMEPVVDRRRVAGGDADLPYRRLRLGRDGALSRRQGRDRARIRSDQGAGFLRAVRHHKAVHGAGGDAVRGAAAARADRWISRG